MNSELSNTAEYKGWLKELKHRVLQVQLRAAVAVNTELLSFYWELGSDIVEKQKSAEWGSGFLKQLSADMMAEFPDIKGFSETNIKFIRRWYLFYKEEGTKGPQVVTQLDKRALSGDEEEKGPQAKKKHVSNVHRLFDHSTKSLNQLSDGHLLRFAK